MTLSVTEATSSPTSGRVPRWVLVVLGVALAAIIALCGTTLYLVSALEDKNAQVEETAKTVTATKAQRLASGRSARPVMSAPEVRTLDDRRQPDMLRPRDADRFERHRMSS